MPGLVEALGDVTERQTFLPQTTSEPSRSTFLMVDVERPVFVAIEPEGYASDPEATITTNPKGCFRTSPDQLAFVFGDRVENTPHELIVEIVTVASICRDDPAAQSTDFEGPRKLANPDPALGKSTAAVRYQVTVENFFGETFEFSVNYDPINQLIGTVKRASGKP